eukprot:scaffold35525_cov118-Isochrysis_galbana.AAC.6
MVRGGMSAVVTLTGWLFYGCKAGEERRDLAYDRAGAVLLAHCSGGNVMNDRVGKHEAVDCVPDALQVAHQRLATRVVVAEVAEGLRHLVHPNGIGPTFSPEAVPLIIRAPPLLLVCVLAYGAQRSDRSASPRPAGRRSDTRHSRALLARLRPAPTPRRLGSARPCNSRCRPQGSGADAQQSRPPSRSGRGGGTHWQPPPLRSEPAHAAVGTSVPGCCRASLPCSPADGAVVWPL